MAELYTWECLWENHCEGCLVGDFVEREGIDPSNQKRMLEVATAAGAMLKAGGSPEGVIEDLLPHSMLSQEATEVSVRGYQQWEGRECRDSIVPIS